MKAKRRTGYGVFDITRQVARLIQEEWEMVESPRPDWTRFKAGPFSPPRPPDDPAKAAPHRLAA